MAVLAWNTHLKSDNRLDRCHLHGQLGDALHAVLCAAGYNIRWLMRAMVRPGLRALLLRQQFLMLLAHLAAMMRAMPSTKPYQAATALYGWKVKCVR